MYAIAAVFIDGGYLDKVLKLDHRSQRIDYAAFAQRLAESHDVLRTYYYHCLPYQSRQPTDDERRRYGAKHSFMTALEHLPGFEVRLGRLAQRGHDDDGRPVFVQKRVDMMIGVDMALLAAKRAIHKAVVLSGDSDMVPAVEAAKREGVRVTLWHGAYAGQNKPSRELVQVCDDRHEITSEVIEGVLLRTRPRRS